MEKDLDTFDSDADDAAFARVDAYREEQHKLHGQKSLSDDVPATLPNEDRPPQTGTLGAGD